MSQVDLGEAAARKLKDVSLSNDVIASRINEISDEVLAQVITAMNSRPIELVNSWKNQQASAT